MADMNEAVDYVQRLKQTLSSFQLYSKGIVAENKPLSTTEVLVVPIERMGFIDGEIAVEDSDLAIEGQDADGKTYTVTMKARSALTCKWLPMDSNRVTPPDVRRGEEVFIYRFADSDDFYWVDTGLAAKLRRLETVAWLFSANPTGDSDDERSAEDSYMVEVSTHKKLVTIQTTKKNGEPFAYTIQLNTGTGYFTVTDDSGNFIELDSPEKRIRAMLSTRTSVELNQQDINLFAPGNITQIAEGDIHQECVNYSLKASGTVSIESNGITSVKASEFTVDAPKSSFSGGVAVAKNIDVVGNLNIGGATSFGGKLSGPNFVIDNGVLTCKSVTASQPIIAPNV